MLMNPFRRKPTFCPPATSGNAKRLAGAGLASLLFVAAGLAALLFMIRNDKPAPDTANPAPPHTVLSAAPPEDLFDESAMSAKPRTLKGKIKPGQTMASLLGGVLTRAKINELAKQSSFPFTAIRAGRPYLLKTLDNAFEYFEYHISPLKKLVIYPENGECEVRVDAQEYDVKTAAVAGTIDSSLFATVHAMGESDELAQEVADIFAWDIDFCRDLRKGDAFKAVVEKRYLKGKFAGYGRVFAAEFVNQGEKHQAFYFKNGKEGGGYYDAEGRSAKKAFLRAPLSFRRISSGFTHSRLHPILRVRKPHLGIDYAAPTGTPVWTVGDGTVVKKGYNKAAGNFVVLRHSRTYSTRYNHLSRYARGLKTGKKYEQGQVIGYVGATGYATGPHLDFRMYRNGKAINSLKNANIRKEPVPGNKLAVYKRHIAPYLDRLDAALPPHGPFAELKKN